MKTNSVAMRPGYGPRPTGPTLRPLTRAQNRVLVVLRGSDGPVSLATLAATTGLHPNTLRGHLEALEGAGLVVRSTFAPDGPGRPAVGFEADPADEGAASPEYAGLARALAASIRRTSRSPGKDGVAAGRDWGRELVGGRRRARRSGATAARREVVALFEEIGFAPEADAQASEVRLTRCPLLDAAVAYPDVVCAVHLGIARGALEAHGADPADVELHPFSEPGACRLRLGGGTGRGRSA
ncbi:MAG TPA: helix-turn-helix domain-containing protein [Marmoricola sp.]|nr:helix-turn-helix domain-containing protein [Marmoricola sp.]